jgi:hypothetical protein
MAYIVERNTRFYVVAYDGLDPLTGRERRRWIPIGHDRTEAESVVARLDSEHTGVLAPGHSPLLPLARSGRVSRGGSRPHCGTPPLRQNSRQVT